MKKIYSWLLMALAATAMTFTSCSTDDEPFATASEDDFPQILLPWFGEWKDGVPGEYKNFSRDIEYIDSVTVTPARYTTVEWFIDNVKVNEGTKYRTYMEAGNYILQIVATTTKGRSTSRTGRIVVRPADGDPVFEDIPEERLVAPGTTATLTGSNLGNVKEIYFGDVKAEIIEVSADQIQYTVPNIDGSYRIHLKDGKNTLGGIYTSDNKTYTNMEVAVSKAPYFKTDNITAKAKRPVTLSGINLDKVKSITIDGKTVLVTKLSATELTFVCPDIENGNYDFIVETTDGSQVSFLGNETCIISVMSAYVLWTGSEDIMGWPAKSLEGVGKQLKELAKVGSILRVTVSPIDADYHQGNVVVDWAGIVTGGYEDARKDFVVERENQVIELVLTAKSIEMLNANSDKVFIVGHGYKITKITIEDPDEIEIYTGPSQYLSWADEDKFCLTFDWNWCQTNGIKEGTLIKAYVKSEITGAIGAIATAWWAKINDGANWEAEGEQIKTSLPEGEYTLEYTVKNTQYLEQQGFGIVGNGFVVNKITIINN